MPRIRLSRFLPATLLFAAVFVAFRQDTFGAPIRRQFSLQVKQENVQEALWQSVFDDDTNSGLVEPRYTRRIVAVGDLHGDYANALRVLQMADVVDEEANWTGKVDLFVQTGDIIDR